MNVEGFESILIERGHEDDRLNVLRSNAGQHVEAVHLRHLDVEKDQIGRERVDGLDRLTAIPALLENLDVRLSVEQHTQVAPRQRLVIYYDCPDLRGHLRTTPKAFANCSPRLERSYNLGFHNSNFHDNPERVRQLPNPFRVSNVLFYSYPGL